MAAPNVLSVILTLIFVLLVPILCFEFTEKPNDVVIVSYGDDLSLSWNFTQHGEYSRYTYIIFYKFENSRRIQLASRDVRLNTTFRYTPEAMNKFGDRIGAVGMAALIIRNITYHDSGYYMIKVGMHPYNDLFHKILVKVKDQDVLPAFHESSTVDLNAKQSGPTSNLILSFSSIISSHSVTLKPVIKTTSTSMTTDIITSLSGMLHTSPVAKSLTPKLQERSAVQDGQDRPNIDHSQIGKNSNNSSKILFTLVSVLALGLITCIALLITGYYKRLTVRGSNNENSTGEDPTRVQDSNKSTTDPYITFNRTTKGDELASNANPYEGLYDLPDLWEIKMDSLTLLNEIGRGEFGVVTKGILTYVDGKLVDVAVKKTQGKSNMADLKEEFKVMRRLPNHNNVIKLLGCVEQSESFWVVTEFAEHGNLLTYLWKRRDSYSTQKHLSGSLLKNCQLEELYSFAKQIAAGMMFLSENKVVHRDLAARNVLLSFDNTCKISDFGFARYSTEHEPYMRKSKGKIPIRWTSIEGLLYNVYTTKSDVWSYGIVLYEIFTIGGEPYPGMESRVLLESLENGYRMPRPQNISKQLYSVMEECWSTDPDSRPNFSDLCLLFEQLQEESKSLLPSENNSICGHANTN